jgi:RNA polymerase sigma factor (TIGR02999 family)
MKSGNITQILQQWSDGDRQALDMLMPLVYNELRRQATRHLGREDRGHTLQPTALIHEAFIKLIDQRSVEWQNRTHFFAIASQAMRRVLVDHARAKHSDKRGGDNRRVSLADDMLVLSDENHIDLIALDEALTRLEKIDNQQARVVELRFFSGLSLEETAMALNISRATAARDWNVAKAWLYRELTR